MGTDDLFFSSVFNEKLNKAFLATMLVCIVNKNNHRDKIVLFRKSSKMILIIFALLISSTTGRYDANWKSLDSRPLPSWYDEGKIGIFLHWGVFSVPAFGSEWFWYNWQAAKSPAYLAYMKENYRPDFTYADFAPMFHAEFYNPLEWADIFQASGASYVVLVTKHHEGFTNWPSNHSFNWNAMDVGPKRDLVGDLANSIRYKTDLKFGVYHSMFEWFNPLYLQDQANNFKTQDFTRTKALPELYELVNNYLPDIIWSDGAWLAPDTYWNATEFLAWLYNDSPVKDTVVVNDRWGSNTPCQHGGFWNCDDKYTPGKLVGHKWEKCMTLDKYSWGYRANARVADILTIEELLADVVRTISLGGNILINAGPTSAGKISPIYEERFRQLGSWLKVNGEAIYKSSVWTYQNDSITPGVWYTSRTDGQQPVIYAIFLSWPKTSSLILGHPLVSSSTKISLVGYTGQLSFSPLASGGVEVVVPAIPASQMPCNWAWVLRMENLKNRQIKIKWDAYSRNVQPISMRKDLP